MKTFLLFLLSLAAVAQTPQSTPTSCVIDESVWKQDSYSLWWYAFHTLRDQPTLVNVIVTNYDGSSLKEPSDVDFNIAISGSTVTITRKQ